METKERIALTEKQQAIVEEFKNLLKRMEDEKIGIVGEFNIDNHYELRHLYLQLFNKQDVSHTERFYDIEEVDEDNEMYLVNKDYVTSVKINTEDVITTSDGFENDVYTVWFTDEV